MKTFKDPDVYLEQVALKHLGFDPGVLDGIRGKNTNNAKSAWLKSLEVGLQVGRWTSARLKPEKLSAIRSIVNRIKLHRSKYESVSAKTGVPWFVIAGLHNMESSGDFTKHLHEGSPLSGRTKFVPKGRPLKGNPPFTWEQSAIDALDYDLMDKINWSSLEASLQAIEAYNGLGYQKYHPETPSPYLWAGTSVEKPGKYVADGKWSPTAISNQIGVAAIFKEMESQSLIKLPS